MNTAIDFYSEEVKDMTPNSRDAYRFHSDMTDISLSKKFSVSMRECARDARRASMNGNVKALAALVKKINWANEPERSRRQLIDLIIDRISDMVGKKPYEVRLEIM